MSQKAAKIGVTTLVLATAFGILMYTTLGESMQYYKYVDEVVAQPPASWEGKTLQMHGYVVPGSRSYWFGSLAGMSWLAMTELLRECPRSRRRKSIADGVRIYNRALAVEVRHGLL